MANPNSSATKLSLKVVIDRRMSKVLFAEADNDFVDVLLSFLTLPLGTVVTNMGGIGSLSSLHAGLSDLNESYFNVRGAKQMLLNPRSSFEASCRKLAVDISDSPNSYFHCQDPECDREQYQNISLYPDVAACGCQKPLNREVRVWEAPSTGVFTDAPSSFIVADDLHIWPVVNGVLQTLASLGFRDTESDTQGLMVKSLSIGIHEIRDLLKLALTSSTPLTHMIFKNTDSPSPTRARVPKPQYRIPIELAHSRKIALKICLQKSTNGFLFAEASYEFIELLLSFLTIPLGRVEYLFGGKAYCLKSIDNLYRSVCDGIGSNYYRGPNRLTNPKITQGYVMRSRFLPLIEEAPRKLCYVSRFNSQHSKSVIKYFHSEQNGWHVCSIKMEKEIYVREEVKYIVSDDLTIHCPGVAAGLSILSGIGIPVSDVREMEVHVGQEEALSILNASLTSKTAITDGLMLTKPVLTKPPKLERQPKQEPL